MPLRRNIDDAGESASRLTEKLSHVHAWVKPPILRRKAVTIEYRDISHAKGDTPLRTAPSLKIT